MDGKHKAFELSDEMLAQVSGGDEEFVYVNTLTDDLIASGKFRIPNDYFSYKNEVYTCIGAVLGLSIYKSPSGKNLLIPEINIQ